MGKPITKANPRTIQSGPLAGRTFETERAYRQALRNVPGKRYIAPSAGTEEKFYKVVKRVANGESLTRAAKAEGTTVETIKKLNRPRDVLAQPKLGSTSKRYFVDTEFSHMPIFSTNGVISNAPLDRVNRAIVANHWNSIRRYAMGQGTLQPYTNIIIYDVNGKTYKLETDENHINTFLVTSDASIFENMSSRKGVQWK